MTKTISITEYHLCRECQHLLSIPNGFGDGYELLCLKNRPELNTTGGLTECEHYNK